jgi:hypothetical protein
MVAVLECNHEYQAHPTDSTPALRNGNDFVRKKKKKNYTIFALTSKNLIIFGICHGFI